MSVFGDSVYIGVADGYACRCFGIVTEVGVGSSGERECVSEMTVYSSLVFRYALFQSFGKNVPVNLFGVEPSLLYSQFISKASVSQ